MNTIFMLGMPQAAVPVDSSGCDKICGLPACGICPQAEKRYPAAARTVGISRKLLWDWCSQTARRVFGQVRRRIPKEFPPMTRH